MTSARDERLDADTVDQIVDLRKALRFLRRFWVLAEQVDRGTSPERIDRARERLAA